MKLFLDSALNLLYILGVAITNSIYTRIPTDAEQAILYA